MIIKSYDIKNYFNKNSIFLFYGENNGLKEEIIDDFFKKNYVGATFNYSEKDVLNNLDNFYNQIYSKSFFDNKKLIIITDASDKIKEEIENLLEQKLDDISIILVSNILEKKSKLRALFEKNSNLITIPFYKDNYKTLGDLTRIFFKKKEILTSQETINIIIEKSSGDRKNLNNELEKIENFSLNKKNITHHEIIKLTNLADNYSASELIDHSLAKNTRKTVTILNENNYSDEDNIIVIRTLLAKLKRLLKICELVDEKNNIDQAISSFKPAIFWKDKPLVTQQIKSWKKEELKNLIYESNEIELLIKKNSSIAKNILSDFIINNSRKINN